ncbi:hypothetical protein JXM67_00240 [candidate division WOR-3 bacterium]|nr:hypothetical protein [candidate division WOR-3 bacterium]
MYKPTMLILALFSAVIPVNVAGSPRVRIEGEGTVISAERATLYPADGEAELAGAQVRFDGLTVRADCISYYSQAQVLAASGDCEFTAEALTVDTEAKTRLPGYICETDGYYFIKGTLTFDEDGEIVITEGDDIVIVRKQVLEEKLD